MGDGIGPLLAVAGSAALASPLGGLIGLKLKGGSLVLSLVVGFAGGVLLGTFAFEMLPKGLEDAGLPLCIAGFIGGLLAVWGLDLFVNRGRMAGDEADQKPRTEAFHRRRKPRGSETMVLASGTASEELIEGLSIGIGMAVEPGLGWMIALAVAFDNVAEGMSLAELSREDGGKHVARRVLGWTALIGASLLASALAGGVLLRDLPAAAMGTLLALGAGGMFYLTVAQLTPEAEAHHYQQSGALAVAAGFLTAFALSTLN